jgi:hypothetical protein
VAVIVFSCLLEENKLVREFPKEGFSSVPPAAAGCESWVRENLLPDGIWVMHSSIPYVPMML